MEQCNYELRRQGRVYPRTCAECGLGPCKYQNKPPIPETAPTDTERVQHVKRGTTYTVVGEAKLQSSGSIAEGAMLTVYRDVNSGALWARPTDEFRDGRFVTLSDPVPLPITTAEQMREAAAKIIENFVEAVELRTNKRGVIPRAHGSLTGLAYADAIRALPIAPTDTERKLALAGEALREAENAFRLVEHPRSIDPLYGEELQRLGDRIGYGALMSSASASWRARLAVDGIEGGEFVSGPCHGTVVHVLGLIRSALAAIANQELQS